MPNIQFKSPEQESEWLRIFSQEGRPAERKIIGGTVEVIRVTDAQAQRLREGGAKFENYRSLRG